VDTWFTEHKWTEHYAQRCMRIADVFVRAPDAGDAEPRFAASLIFMEARDRRARPRQSCGHVGSGNGNACFLSVGADAPRFDQIKAEV
jgi:hypothetical protein